MTEDDRLIRVDVEIKRVSNWISDREWEGHQVAPSMRSYLANLRKQLKEGVTHVPKF